MRIDSPKVSNLTFQSGSGVADSAFTGSFTGSFTGVGNFTGLTADSVEYANVLNKPNGVVSGSSAQARAQIGSIIGTDVQAYHENLNDISNLNPTDSTFIVGAGSSFVLESGNTVRSSLGLGSLAVLNTDSTLSSINLSGNSSYSFANLTNLPTLFSGSGQISGIGNEQLSNSSINIDGATVSLGDTITTLQLGNTITTALAGNTTTITTGQADAITANTAKETNVSTNLSITGTTGARTIVSSDGDNAVIPVATTSVSGVMSKAIFDEHVVNNAKVSDINHNVSTNLSKTVSGTGFSINSSDGDNVALTLATTDNWGIMSDEMFDKLDGIEAGATADQSNAEIRAAVEAATDSNVFTDADHTKLNNIEANATADQTASEIRTLVGTGNSNFVPAAGASGTFLAHDGVYRTPSYTTNTDTNTNQLTTWTLRDDDNDDVTIGQGKFIKFVSATGTAGTNITGAGTTGDPYIVTITSPDTDTNTNTQLTNEQVQDIVGGMLGGTETGISVTYQDSTGDIDFVVATQTANDFTNTLKSKLDNIEENATADLTGTEIKALVGTGNGALVPSAGTAGHFLKHDGTFGLPSYTTNTNATRNSLGIDTDDNVAFEGLIVGSSSGATANTIRCTGDIVAYFSSDEQFKDNIVTLDGALDKVKAIRGVRFDWNDKQDVYEGHDIGVIAQEVEAVLPELVHEREHNNSKAVDYVKLTAVLIEAVKELSAKVDELETKCNC